MKLLFVCSGNTCRSPLAEAIARREVRERGLLDVDVSSAGTSAWDGAPASDGSLLVAIERGVEIADHRSRPLTAQIVAESDVILTMGAQHLRRVAELGGEGKAFLLSEYASRGETADSISDPFGGDLEIYRSTFDELDAHIRRVFDRIAAEQGSGPAT